MTKEKSVSSAKKEVEEIINELMLAGFPNPRIMGITLGNRLSKAKLLCGGYQTYEYGCTKCPLFSIENKRCSNTKLFRSVSKGADEGICSTADELIKLTKKHKTDATISLLGIYSILEAV